MLKKAIIRLFLFLTIFTCNIFVKRCICKTNWYVKKKLFQRNERINSHNIITLLCPIWLFTYLLSVTELRETNITRIIFTRSRSKKLVRASLLSGGWFRFNERCKKENELLRQLTPFIQVLHLFHSLFASLLKEALLRSKARTATRSIRRSSSSESRWTSHYLLSKRGKIGLLRAYASVNL